MPSKQKLQSAVSRNIYELAAIRDLESQGFFVTNSGWPDLLAINWETLEVRFVEVKKPGTRLRAAQKHMKRVLESIGIKYEIVRPKIELHVSRRRRVTKQKTTIVKRKTTVVTEQGLKLKSLSTRNLERALKKAISSNNPIYRELIPIIEKELIDRETKQALA